MCKTSCCKNRVLRIFINELAVLFVSLSHGGVPSSGVEICPHIFRFEICCVVLPIDRPHPWMEYLSMQNFRYYFVHLILPIRVSVLTDENTNHNHRYHEFSLKIGYLGRDLSHRNIEYPWNQHYPSPFGFTPSTTILQPPFLKPSHSLPLASKIKSQTLNPHNSTIPDPIYHAY